MIVRGLDYYFTQGPENECWTWAGAYNSKGYGYYSGQRGRNIPAHRAVYEFLIGPIPVNKHLDHKCKNHSCVNPNHLEIVTCKENIRRGRVSKLTVKLVEQLKYDVKHSNLGYRSLSNKYNISVRHLQDILAGKYWDDVKIASEQ